MDQTPKIQPEILAQRLQIILFGDMDGPFRTETKVCCTKDLHAQLRPLIECEDEFRTIHEILSRDPVYASPDSEPLLREQTDSIRAKVASLY